MPQKAAERNSTDTPLKQACSNKCSASFTQNNTATKTFTRSALSLQPRLRSAAASPRSREDASMAPAHPKVWAARPRPQRPRAGGWKGFTASPRRSQTCGSGDIGVVIKTLPFQSKMETLALEGRRNVSMETTTHPPAAGRTNSWCNLLLRAAASARPARLQLRLETPAHLLPSLPAPKASEKPNF